MLQHYITAAGPEQKGHFGNAEAELFDIEVWLGLILEVLTSCTHATAVVKI